MENLFVKLFLKIIYFNSIEFQLKEALEFSVDNF